MFLAKRFEILDREISLSKELSRPAPRKLYRHFLRVFLSPPFQVGGKEFFALLSLVATMFAFFIVRTASLICFLALLANIEMPVSHLRMTIKLIESF